jgi:hypothetical protein
MEAAGIEFSNGAVANTIFSSACAGKLLSGEARRRGCWVKDALGSGRLGNRLDDMLERIAHRSAAVTTVSGIFFLGPLEANFDTGGLHKCAAWVTVTGYKGCGEDDDNKSF